jgi:hypothetical protein
MLICIPYDILTEILLLLPIEMLFRLKEVCRFLNDLVNEDQFSYNLAIKLYGYEFWLKAWNRPPHISKPLDTWIDEVCRIEKFQKMIKNIEGKRYTNQQFYTIWEVEKRLY